MADSDTSHVKQTVHERQKGPRYVQNVLVCLLMCVGFKESKSLEMSRASESEGQQTWILESAAV